MPLKNATLVKLQRTQPGADIVFQPATTCQPVDGLIHPLFENARNAFLRHAGKQFGFFTDDANSSVSLLSEWLAQKTDFLAMANLLSAHLQEQVNPTDLPFSTVLLAAEEQLLGQHYFYLFWLPLVDCIQVDAELRPCSSQYIAAERPTYALRLDLDKWTDQGSPKYLTLLSTRGDAALAKAWTGFCGFREGIDTSRQTREFLQIVDDFSHQLPEEKAQSVKSSIVEYCLSKDKTGQPVIIEELSTRLHDELPAAVENPRDFAGFVNQRQETPQPEIQTHRASLKRYIRFFGRDESLSISFSADRLGKDIRYDPASGGLNIARIPKSLKNQLVSPEKNE